MDAMNCPKCQTPLAAHTVQDVAVQRCGSCDGLWFTEAGFHAAKDHAEPDAAWMHVDLWKDHARFEVRSRKLACPSCAKVMVALRYDKTPVEIDYCADCRGIWLDAAEFEGVVAALEDELARIPSTELAREALREALEVVKNPGSLLSEWRDASTVLRLLKLRVLVEHPTLMKLVMRFQRSTPFT